MCNGVHRKPQRCSRCSAHVGPLAMKLAVQSSPQTALELDVQILERVLKTNVLVLCTIDLATHDHRERKLALGFQLSSTG